MPKRTAKDGKKTAKKDRRQVHPSISRELAGLLDSEATKRGVQTATLAGLWLFEYAKEKFPEFEPV